MPLRVGVEEVVGAGIVLVDAALHEPHAEHAGVEVEVLLRGSGDRGDVVEPVDALHAHSMEHLVQRMHELWTSLSLSLPGVSLVTIVP